MAPPAMTRRRLGIGGDVARWHPLRQWVLLAAVVGDDGDIRAAPFGRGDKVVGAAGPFVDAAENMVGTAQLMLRRIDGADGADRKSTRLNSSHYCASRIQSSA